MAEPVDIRTFTEIVAPSGTELLFCLLGNEPRKITADTLALLAGSDTITNETETDLAAGVLASNGATLYSATGITLTGLGNLTALGNITVGGKFIGSGAGLLSVPQSAVTNLTTDLAAKAPIASPTFTGTVSGITKSMVGLGNVDNTSDASKPVSTATQTALDLKAPIASPTFTGTATAPTFSGNHTGSGASLTNLPAGNLTGTVADARLGNAARTNACNTFSFAQTFATIDTSTLTASSVITSVGDVIAEDNVIASTVLSTGNGTIPINTPSGIGGVLFPSVPDGYDPIAAGDITASVTAYKLFGSTRFWSSASTPTTVNFDNQESEDYYVDWSWAEGSDGFTSDGYVISITNAGQTWYLDVGNVLTYQDTADRSSMTTTNPATGGRTVGGGTAGHFHGNVTIDETLTVPEVQAGNVTTTGKYIGSGQGLYSIPAGNLTGNVSTTILSGNLTSSVPNAFRTNANNTVSGNNTFTATQTFANIAATGGTFSGNVSTANITATGLSSSGNLTLQSLQLQSTVGDPYVQSTTSTMQVRSAQSAGIVVLQNGAVYVGGAASVYSGIRFGDDNHRLSWWSNTEGISRLGTGVIGNNTTWTHWNGHQLDTANLTISNSAMQNLTCLTVSNVVAGNYAFELTLFGNHSVPAEGIRVNFGTASTATVSSFNARGRAESPGAGGVNITAPTLVFTGNITNTPSGACTTLTVKGTLVVTSTGNITPQVGIASFASGSLTIYHKLFEMRRV